MNVVDSGAWLEYFAGGPNAEFFARAIEKTSELIVPSLCPYEVFNRILDQRGEFFDIYAPLLYRYARARRLSRVDFVEVRDQCLAIVARKIGGFEYDRRNGTFKSWLRRIADSKVADLLRSRRPGLAGSGVLESAAARSTSPADYWEHVWELEHIRYSVERVRGEVSEPSFQAFRLDRLPAASLDCDRDLDREYCRHEERRRTLGANHRRPRDLRRQARRAGPPDRRRARVGQTRRGRHPRADRQGVPLPRD